MTREEAIIKLTQLKNKFLEEYIDYDGTTSAYNLAIEALEKQMPKSPVYLTDWYAGKCPVCDRRVYRYDNCCRGCGQKLYWDWVN